MASVFFAVVDTPANAQVIYGTIMAEPEGLADSQPVPIATRNALKGAMKHSIRLAQRSYRMAVPQFYRGRIQLLLSLYLRDSKRPDLALTLERHGRVDPPSSTPRWCSFDHEAPWIDAIQGGACDYLCRRLDPGSETHFAPRSRKAPSGKCYEAPPNSGVIPPEAQRISLRPLPNSASAVVM